MTTGQIRLATPERPEYAQINSTPPFFLVPTNR